MKRIVPDKTRTTLPNTVQYLFYSLLDLDNLMDDISRKISARGEVRFAQPQESKSEQERLSKKRERKKVIMLVHSIPRAYMTELHRKSLCERELILWERGSGRQEKIDYTRRNGEKERD